MDAPDRRKISAAQILSDIRAGMGDSALRTKYGLSDNSLKKVYKKLTDAGLLKEHELPGRSPAGPARPEPPKIPSTHIAWRCPACNTPQSERFEECPQCGAITAKVEGRFGAGIRERRFEEPRYEEPESSGGGKWVAVAVSVAILLVVGTVLLKWATHRSSDVSMSGGAVGVCPAVYHSELRAGSH